MGDGTARRGVVMPGWRWLRYRSGCKHHCGGTAILVKAALILITIVAVACDDGPCLALSLQVCDCELSTSSRDRCATRVRNAADLEPASGAADSVCQDILNRKTCTCDAIDRGELARCGLAPLPPNPDEP